jgi:hypothetical protein
MCVFKHIHKNDFEDLYCSMKFNEYLFSMFTTENEKGKERLLFVTSSCYSLIIQSYNKKNTILLTGDRDTCKTAILLDSIRNIDINKIDF